MKKNLEFQIGQLRQDKIILAVETVAINSLCFLLFTFSTFLPVPIWVPIGIVAFAFLYTLYALIGNLFRLKKIKKLEKSL
jgi:hypothetical protein